MVADIDIYRSARILIDRHGPAARTVAEKRVADCEAAGDGDGRFVWMRIRRAIAEISPGPPPGATAH